MLVTRTVLVALLAYSSASAQAGSYADPEGRFSFQYPTSWSVRTTPAGVIARSDDGVATFAVAPARPRDGVSLADLADGFEQMLRRSRPQLAVEVVEDAARRIGTCDAHHRALRVGGEDEAVRLDMHVMAGAGYVLTSSASAPAARYADYSEAFESMLVSLAGADAPPPADDAELEQKLQALEAAHDAGVLTDAEFASKKAQLEARLREGRPDPTLERKLKALEAAREAGVLDAAEYERKRAELTAKYAAPAPTDAPEPPAGRKGEIYRHPIGFSFWRPDGWKVQEKEDFLQLVPPDPAMAEGGPLELYFVIGDTVEGTGITRPDDPQVIEYLDQQVRSIVATLERKGRPVPVPTTNGNGAAIDWSCKTPDGRDLLSRCYVTIIREHGVALLALGLPDKIAPREAELRAMFASFGIGEGEKDAALVGSWHLVSTTAITNQSPFETDWSRARAVGETQSRISLAADGTYERVDDWHMIVIAGDVSLEDKQRDVDRGRWCAGGGALYLVSEDKTWRDYLYRVERTGSGARLRLVTGDRGEIWEPAK